MYNSRTAMKFISKIFSFIVISFVLFVAFIFGIRGCTDEETARRVLENNGYKNVEITGYRYFMRSDTDMFSTGFVATSPNGSRVSGAVCSGYFKGATIRFD